MLRTDRFSICYPVACALWQLSEDPRLSQCFTVQALQAMLEKLWVGNTGPQVWLKLAQAVRKCVDQHHSRMLQRDGDANAIVSSLHTALLTNWGEHCRTHFEIRSELDKTLRMAVVCC